VVVVVLDQIQLLQVRQAVLHIFHLRVVAVGVVLMQQIPEHLN
jgi:hypothetical protein